MQRSHHRMYALTRRGLPLGLLLAVLLPARAQEAPDARGVEFFEKKIRPVLVERCYRCHGADPGKVKGGFRLDTREGLLHGGDSGPAVVPGAPERSLLIKAIRYTDPSLRMPPGKKRLSPQEVADFEEWVKRGLLDPRTQAAARPAPGPETRWAFQPPKEPPLPHVRQEGWVHNPIDRFILAGLEAKGLHPAPPADKHPLLRRVTFDLTGLPPTPAELDAFLADKSPEAFAHVVDRLLASPRYGERWGRHWLDLTRYTDDFAEAWRYRDWVVRAFNDDLPYDQFVRQQIAGDLLPARSPGAMNADGIVATTLLTIGPWGGIDRKKRMADIVDDQIDTVGRTFLGLTLACARCHDHKFDPIPTRDYYGLAGIFYSTRVFTDKEYLSHGAHRLRIPLVPPSEVEKHRRHMARVQEAEKKLNDAVEERYTAFSRSLLPQAGRYLLAAWEYQHRPADQASLSAEDWAAKRGLHAFAVAAWVAYLGNDHFHNYGLLKIPVQDYDGEPGVQVWGAHAERPWWGVNTNRADVPIETWVLPPRSVSMNPGVEGGAVAWKSPITGRVKVTGRLTDADPLDGAGVSWAVDLTAGRTRHELSSADMPNGGDWTLDRGRHPERLAAIDVKAGDVVSLQIWLRQGDAHYDITNVAFKITRLDAPGEWDLGRDVMDNFLASNPHPDSQGNAGVWAFYDLAGSGRRTRMPATDAALDAWYRAPSGDRAALAKAAWDFQQAVDAAGADGPLARDLTGPRSPFWVRARDDAKYLSPEAQADLARRAADVEVLKAQTPPLPCAHGVQEGGACYSLFPGIGDARIHVRGSYEQLGPRVPRHLPSVLAGDHQPPITRGSGRLELANWLASPDNPLTARVMVNRIWQHHFGEGIVRTPSNFGRLGTPPTHPELLDYLARRFVESGWSAKAMHRLILLSAAYQQSSRPPPETLRADPNNLLFGRLNRQRLEAEAVRDSLLAVSGCFDTRPGGPADGDHSSARRMLYLRSSRSDKSSFGPLFDAADPWMHVDRRNVSTVAPQALFLMNDPQVTSWVSRLAGRPRIAGLAKPEDRIRALYRLLFAREPSAEEVAAGRRFVESQAGQPPAGGSGVGAPLGPWEAYAQALLLSNEFLFVD